MRLDHVATIVRIEDPDDPRIEAYRHLTDAELRRDLEAREGLFVAESVGVVERLLESAHPVRSLLLTPRRLEALATRLDAVTAPVYVAEKQVLRAVAGFDVHRGALALGERLPPPSVERLLATTSLLAVLEGVTDHENLGSLFRSAAAFGAGVLLSPTSGDPLYRRSVRVSMGHALHVPCTTLAPWPGALEDLRRAGTMLLALTPDPAATPLEDVRRDGRPVALLLGAEGPGLSAGARAEADEQVRIPMAPGVDSLNVAVAGAIALHHLARGLAGP